MDGGRRFSWFNWFGLGVYELNFCRIGGVLSSGGETRPSSTWPYLPGPGERAYAAVAAGGAAGQEERLGTADWPPEGGARAAAVGERRGVGPPGEAGRREAGAMHDPAEAQDSGLKNFGRI